jgi:hypothetical protein
MMPKDGFSVINSLAKAGVEDDDVKSLVFIFHVMENPTFIGDMKRMEHRTIRYELEGAEEYDDMLDKMQNVIDDMLSKSFLLSKIEVEVEREDFESRPTYNSRNAY